MIRWVCSNISSANFYSSYIFSKYDFSLQDALSQLTEMGFSDTRAKKALLINKYVLN